MKKILIDYKDIKDFEGECDPSLLTEGFIFNDCCLIVQNHPGVKRDFKITLHFEPDKKAMWYAVFDTSFNVRTYIFIYDVMKGFSYGRIDKEIEDDECEAAGGVLNLALNIIQTIKEMSYNKAIYYKKHEDEKIEDSQHLNKLKKQKKKMKVPDLFLADELVYYAAINIPEEKLKRHINCPVWDVRGFYRHYKNGNVVWINSFQKGRDRNKGMSPDRTYNASKHDKK